MTKTTKRKTVIMSLLLSVALTFGFLFIGKQDNTVVKADTVTNGHFITVDNVVGGEKGAMLTYTEGSGLLVDSEGDSAENKDSTYNMVGEYSGRINGVFDTTTGSSNTIKFSFPVVSNISVEQEFTFKVEDASGVGDYFLVKYYAQQAPGSGQNQKVGKIAIIYVKANTRVETFRAVDWGGNVLKSKAEADAVEGGSQCIAVPTIGDATEGYFTLAWANDVLTVKAPMAKQNNAVSKPTEKNIVSFNDEANGLPKIAFTNGYKISFTSNSCQDVLFTEIGGTDLKVEQTTDPTWYKSGEKATATIMLDGKVQRYYPANKAFALPTARWLSNDSQGNATLAVKKETGEEVVASTDGTYTLAAENYTAVYTGGATGVTGNEQSIAFTVQENMFTDMSNLISAKDATVQKTTVGRHTGTLVSAEAAYSGEINGLFGSAENTEIEFLLPASNANNTDFNLKFKVENVGNPSEYFEIEYYWVTGVTNVNKGPSVIVNYVNDDATTSVAYYYVFTNVAKTNIATAKDTTSDNVWRAQPKPGNDARKGYFKLVWENDGVLGVYTPLTYNGATGNYTNSYCHDVAIAKFDGTETAVMGTAPGRAGTGNTYGLPKLTWTKGYKISFESATKQSIMFTNIATGEENTDLALDFATSTPVWYENYLNAQQEVKAEINAATLSLSTDIAVRFYVEAEKLASYEESKMDVTFMGKTATLEGKDVEIGNVAYKEYTLYGISPHQMNDEIRAVLYGKKAGEATLAALDEMTYSVKTYCDNQLAKTDADVELKKVCTALLNYGSAAQVYKNYKTDNLAAGNAYNATPETPTYTKSASQTNEKAATMTFGWMGASLILEDKVSFKFLFKINEHNLYNSKTIITYGDNKTYEIKYNNNNDCEQEVIDGQTYFVVRFEELSAADLSKDITIKIVNSSNAARTETLTYSVEAYANWAVTQSNEKLKNLSIYLMDYVNAVKAYVDAGNA